MNILNIYFLNQKVLMSQGVNRLIYYFKKIPFVGTLLPDTAYCSPTIKKVFTIIMAVLRILKIILTKVFYVASLAIPVAVVQSNVNSQVSKSTMFLVLFFIVSGIAGSFFASDTMSPRKDTYVMIRLMRLDARRYVFARWIQHYIIDTVVIFFCFLFVSNMFDMPMGAALFMTLFYLGAHVLGELWFLYQAQVKNRFLANNNVYMITGMIIFVSIGYGTLFLPWQIDAIMPVVLYGLCTFTLCLGLLAFRYIMKHMDFSALMNEAIRRNHEVIDYKTVMRDSRFKDVQLNDKDYNTKELTLKRFEHLRGYAYLNALFFQRHKRLIYRPMRFRIIFITITTISLVLLMLITKFDAISNNFDIPPIELMSVVPFFTFIMYFSSIGEKITRAMFYNCDIALLRYGYYREAKAILMNFRIRLRAISMYNIIIALLICISTIIINVVGNFQFSLWDVGLSMLTILSLAVFFSIHHLFLYYVLQPYTGELDMRNPLFGVVNGIVYFLCYFSIQLTGNIYYVCTVLAITILYCIVALILVYKLAPKTFRIR